MNLTKEWMSTLADNIESQLGQYKGHRLRARPISDEGVEVVLLEAAGEEKVADELEESLENLLEAFTLSKPNADFALEKSIDGEDLVLRCEVIEE